MNPIQDFVSSVNGYAFTAISAIAVIGITWFVWRIVAILVRWVKNAAFEHSWGPGRKRGRNMVDSPSYPASWYKSFRRTAPWRYGR